MRSRTSVLLLLFTGFVAGVFFVMSCGSGGGGGIISAGAQTATDMTGVESRLDQLITINNQLLTVNSQLLSRAGGTVNSGNHSPIAVASAQSLCVVSGSGTAMLIGSGSSDADAGDILTYKWQFVDIPYGSTAKLNDPGVVNPSFTVDVPGAYRVRLTVSDGSLYSTQTVVITGAVSCP